MKHLFTFVVTHVTSFRVTMSNTYTILFITVLCGTGNRVIIANDITYL